MWRKVPCEQQLDMGESVLRDRRSLFERWRFLGNARLSKGNLVNIPESSSVVMATCAK